MFSLYTGVKFQSIDTDKRGVTTSFLLDAPPGKARGASAGQRAAFWEGVGSKRLMLGGLVALVWKPNDRPVEVHLGVIANPSHELVEHVKRHKETLFLRISLFDASVQMRVLRELRSPSKTQGLQFLVESPVLYDSVKPFLEALCRVPEDIPFSDYLVLQAKENLAKKIVAPPRYAAMPGFRYDLSGLFDEPRQLKLDVRSEESISRARKELEASRLDPSQADAVMDTLTREVALIQGYVCLVFSSRNCAHHQLNVSRPPGTGKVRVLVRPECCLTSFQSYTGVEILRVLIANKVGPIVMIAFTNHALDHMLTSVLDKKITDKVVRLGRRSKDERMAQYSIEVLEEKHGQSQLSYSVRSLYRDLKDLEEKMEILMRQVKDTAVQHTDVMVFLKKTEAPHHALLDTLPAPISALHEIWLELDDGFRTMGKGGQAKKKDKTTFGFWLGGGDLELVRQVLDGSYAPWTAAQTEVAIVQDRPENTEVSGHDEEDEEEDEEPADSNPEEQWMKHMVFEEETSPGITLPPTAPLAPVGQCPVAEQPGGSHPDELWRPLVASEDETSLIPLQPSIVTAPSEPDPVINDSATFFASLGFPNAPSVPHCNRPIDELLRVGSEVWSMSLPERRKLHQHWSAKVRESKMMEYEEKYEQLRTEHESTVRLWNEAKNTVSIFVYDPDDKLTLSAVSAPCFIKPRYHWLYDQWYVQFRRYSNSH